MDESINRRTYGMDELVQKEFCPLGVKVCFADHLALWESNIHVQYTNLISTVFNTVTHEKKKSQ